MKQFMLLILIPLIVMGCSSNYHRVDPAVTPINTPQEGETATANIGDNILLQATYYTFDAIELRQELSRNFGCHNATAGWYIKTSTDSDFDYYTPAPKTRNGGHFYIAGGLCLGWVDAIKRERDTGDLCLRNNSVRDLCDDDDDFNLTTLELLHLNSIQKSLIYNGMVGNKVLFAYREFSHQSNATHYSNNVEYDLNESNVIGYKGVKIEILEATNRYLRYRVIKHLAH